MIILKKKKNQPFGEKLESKLKELVLAFKTEELDGSSGMDVCIVDGNKKITGEENLALWLQKLEAELKWMRSLSGDGCYIDPESGDIC